MPANTSAAGWKRAAAQLRRDASVEIELPSGAVVRACRPGVEHWMLRGRMPEALSAVVLALTGDDRRKLTPAELAELGRFNRDIVIATVVEPKIVLDAPGDGEIAYGDIPDADAEFLLEWARRAPEVASLESFRQRAGLPAAGAGVEDVRPAAEPDAGHPGPGAGARPRHRGRGTAADPRERQGGAHG
jgi:hypothetical protein